MMRPKIVYRHGYDGDVELTPLTFGGDYAIQIAYDHPVNLPKQGWWYFRMDVKEQEEPIVFTSVYQENGKTIFDCPENF